jgi:hypothetical protein
LTDSAKKRKHHEFCARKISESQPGNLKDHEQKSDLHPKIET